MQQTIKIKNIIIGTGLILAVYASAGGLAQKIEQNFLAKAHEARLAQINYSDHRLLPYDSNIFVKADAKYYEELAKHYENRARTFGKIADYTPFIVVRAN